MSIPKYGKRDGNEKEIVEALRAVGASVQYLSISNGPDLLVGYTKNSIGTTYLFETKMPKGKLKEGQKSWAESWQGSAVVVVRCVEDALKAIGVI